MHRRTATAAGSIALGACAVMEAKPKPAAAIHINDDPYPSTYERYPGVVTVIRHATVFDGDGHRIDNRTFVLRDGKIEAVGGSHLARPKRTAEIHSTCQQVTPRNL